MSLRDYMAALADLPVADGVARAGAEARQASLTKPVGSLGRLEELAVFMAGWRVPRIDRAQALVFAGNHGICDRRVNPFPQGVTAQMVANFRNGGAAINQLAAVAGAELSVIALDLDRPTRDFTHAPAMTEAGVLDALRIGAEAVDPTADVLVVGEMGIGNSTTAAALACATFGGDPADWVGAGTGASGDMQALKAQVIAEGLALHADLLREPLGAFRAFGGREQVAMAGAVIAARRHRIPVILDGFIGTASVTPVAAWLDHCLIGHASAERGHAALAARLGKRPILDLGMRLGEGSGAAVALMVLRAAVAAHGGMATFAEAGVSGA